MISLSPPRFPASLYVSPDLFGQAFIFRGSQAPIRAVNAYNRSCSVKIQGSCSLSYARLLTTGSHLLVL